MPELANERKEGDWGEKENKVDNNDGNMCFWIEILICLFIFIWRQIIYSTKSAPLMKIREGGGISFVSMEMSPCVGGSMPSFVRPSIHRSIHLFMG